MYPEIDEAKNLIAELCRLFYDQVRPRLGASFAIERSQRSSDAYFKGRRD